MIRDLNCLPGGIDESNSLKIADVEKCVPNWFNDALAKYAATVVVKSLIVIEGEEERERIRRKKRIATIVLRYGSALMLGGTIVRIVSSHPTAVSWYFPKRDTELTVLELAVYVDRLLVVVVCIVSMVEVSLKRTAVGAM